MRKYSKIYKEGSLKIKKWPENLKISWRQSLVSSLLSRKKKNTAKNIVVPPNFLVWKFCGKAQYPQSFGRIARNSAGTVPIHKTSTSGNWVELP